MILRRDVIASAQLERRRHHVVQHAVDAVADADLAFVGLDVDVARAPLHRRHQHEVHQADNRRVLPLAREGRRADVLEIVEHLDVGRLRGRHVFQRA